MVTKVPVVGAAPAGTGLDARLAAGAVFALAGEAIVVLLALSQTAMPMLLASHVLVVVLLGMILFSKNLKERDMAVPAAVWLAVAVAGPAGAAAALAAFTFEGSAGAGPKVLKRWYARLTGAGKPSPEAVIFDRIASGRVPNLDAPAPKNFLEVVNNGSLEERQKALGLIARRFHPDYTPVLEAALNSPEPVVRVQAAAVVARVRDNLKATIKLLTGSNETLTVAGAIERAALLQALAKCNLVSSQSQTSCRETALRILQNAMSESSAMLGLAAVADEEAAKSAEAFLIANGRFRELRVTRRLRGLTRDGRYRLRRLRAGEAA